MKPTTELNHLTPILNTRIERHGSENGAYLSKSKARAPLFAAITMAVTLPVNAFLPNSTPTRQPTVLTRTKNGRGGANTDVGRNRKPFSTGVKDHGAHDRVEREGEKTNPKRCPARPRSAYPARPQLRPGHKARPVLTVLKP